ncbi:MAG: hypothetical protein JWP52_599 [Rhizobacter sp.]|nr:hypothetical protein [Rhizobacter sp.]
MNHLKTLKALTLAAALVAAALPAAHALPVSAETGPNLVTNGGFETGDYAGWTATGLSFLAGVDGLAAHSGDYGFAGGTGTLTQDIATVDGASYNIHFWLRNDGATPNRFVVQWGGTTVFDSSGLGAFEYQEFVIDPIGMGSSTQLSLGFSNDFGFIEFDDVAVAATVAAVPEPSTCALFGLGLAGLIAWRRRQRA